MSIDKLDDIVNKYNNTYQIPIKMRPLDIKSSTYTGFDKKNNKEHHKFKAGDHVRVSQNIKHICKRLRSKLVQRNFCYYKG